MDVSLKEIIGNWDRGFVLHKHTLSSTYLGDDEYGHPRFDTKRSEVGEALFQMKYRGDKARVGPLAQQLADSIIPKFEKIGLIVPVPASNARDWQPVHEVAKALGEVIKVPVFNDIIVKLPQEQVGQQLKDLHTKEEKAAALKGKFGLNDSIENTGHWNALLIDDLFDTGASMEAACDVLRSYPKINKIFVAALTWK